MKGSLPGIVLFCVLGAAVTGRGDDPSPAKKQRPTPPSTSATERPKDPAKKDNDWFASLEPHERAFLDQILFPEIKGSTDLDSQMAKYAAAVLKGVPEAKGKTARILSDLTVFSGPYKEGSDLAANVDCQLTKLGPVALSLARKAAPKGPPRCAAVTVIELSPEKAPQAVEILMIERTFEYVKDRWTIQSTKSHPVP